MKDAAEFLKAVGSLWPILALLLVWKFYPDLAALLRRESVRIKLPGGAELSAEKFSESVSKLLSDLQERVGKLESIRVANSEISDPKQVSNGSGFVQHSRVLWVDDNPDNNALIIAGLGQDRFTFDLAGSTEEALQKLSSKEYDLVVTDMGRVESKNFNPAAGTDLLRELVKLPRRPKAAVFSSREGLQRFGEEARKLGADYLTNSPTEIANYIRSFRT